MNDIVKNAILEIENSYENAVKEANAAKDQVLAAMKDLGVAGRKVLDVSSAAAYAIEALKVIQDNADKIGDRISNALDDLDEIPEKMGFEDYAGRCCGCGAPLAEGEEHMDINGDIYCADCCSNGNEELNQDGSEEADDDEEVEVNE